MPSCPPLAMSGRLRRARSPCSRLELAVVVAQCLPLVLNELPERQAIAGDVSAGHVEISVLGVVGGGGLEKLRTFRAPSARSDRSKLALELGWWAVGVDDPLPVRCREGRCDFDGDGYTLGQMQWKWRVEDRPNAPDGIARVRDGTIRGHDLRLATKVDGQQAKLPRTSHCVPDCVDRLGQHREREIQPGVCRVNVHSGCCRVGNLGQRLARCTRPRLRGSRISVAHPVLDVCRPGRPRRVGMRRMCVGGRQGRT